MLKLEHNWSQNAQQLYGDFRFWTLIFEANRNKLANPSLIWVGVELRVPGRNRLAFYLIPIM